MTPRLYHKRHGAVVLLCTGLAVVCAPLQSVIAQTGAAAGGGSRTLVEIVQAARTNVAGAPASQPVVQGEVLPLAVKRSEAALRLQRDFAAMRSQGGFRTTVSNGVVVIPESVVAVPDAPLSSDPAVAVQQLNERWTKKQHDLIYADPELKTLHDEIRAMEKTLLGKRQMLDARLSADPGMAKINEERRKAFEALMKSRQNVSRTAPAAQP